jgi:hypothetical protein
MKTYSLRYFRSALLLALVMVFLAACSSNDDDYQAASRVKADCQQVHFTSDNAETILLDPTDPSSYQIALKVARNTTVGTLTVPVERGSTTSPAIEMTSEVVFADGDSTATLLVTVPQGGTEGTSYPISATLTGDEVDPYAYLGMGLTYEGAATVPSTVKFQCWISGQLPTKWEETAIDLSGGHYRIADFMHSGYALDLTITNGVLNVSVPADSPLYTEESDYGTYIYWYTDDYLNLYPYGKDGGVVVNDLCILNSSTYNSYIPQQKYGWFMLSEFMTTEMTDPAYWVYLSFQFE